MVEARTWAPCHLMLLLFHCLPWILLLIPSVGRKVTGRRACPLSNHPCSFFPSPENKEAEQPWQKCHRQAPPMWKLPRTVSLKTHWISRLLTASSAKRGGSREGREGSLIIRRHSSVMNYFGAEVELGVCFQSKKRGFRKLLCSLRETPWPLEDRLSETM